MSEEEIKLKWKVFEKKGKDMHMLENLCIFIAKKENRLITEFKEIAEGNIMFVVGVGGGGMQCSKCYQYSAVNPSTSEPLPFNLTAHGHCKVRAKEC